MGVRTDLAVETLDFAKELSPEGVEKKAFEKDGVEVTQVKIVSETGARLTGKPVGEYLTVETSDFKTPTANFERDVNVIAELLAERIPRSSDQPVLVVGLGNQQITPDALGPKAVEYTLATRHITGELASRIGLEGLQPVAVIAPGVLGQTGIESAEIVASVAASLKPSCVVVIDALAARSVDRLATTVQISDAGINPGSGVQNSRKALSRETLGVPVISVGVPMVVDMTTVAYDMLGEGGESEKVSDKGRTMMVTPREIDLAIEHAAKTVAFAINRALQPSLTLEELMGLAG